VLVLEDNALFVNRMGGSRVFGTVYSAAVPVNAATPLAAQTATIYFHSSF